MICHRLSSLSGMRATFGSHCQMVVEEEQGWTAGSPTCTRAHRTTRVNNMQDMIEVLRAIEKERHEK